MLVTDFEDDVDENSDILMAVFYIKKSPT